MIERRSEEFGRGETAFGVRVWCTRWRPVTMLSLVGVDVLEVEPVERTMLYLAGRLDDGAIAEGV
jgi:hypothetical protein